MTTIEHKHGSIVSGVFTLSDICSNKHGGNAESVNAHEKIKESLPRRRKAILSIYLAGDFTSKEIANIMNVQLNTISGRFTELKDLGYLKSTGARVMGSAVLTLTDAGRHTAMIWVGGRNA